MAPSRRGTGLISLTVCQGCGIDDLQADPCGVRIEGVQLKEPIPVLREIRSCRTGNAYLIGLSDASNDHPPDSNGFPSMAFLRHRWR